MPIYKRGGNSGIPAIESGDAGKVLAVKVDESGYELQTPSTVGADEAVVLAIVFATGY